MKSWRDLGKSTVGSGNGPQGPEAGAEVHPRSSWGPCVLRGSREGRSSWKEDRGDGGPEGREKLAITLGEEHVGHSDTPDSGLSKLSLTRVERGCLEAWVEASETLFLALSERLAEV